MRGWIVALYLGGLVAGCQEEQPVAGKLDYSRTKKLHVKVTYPEIGKVVQPMSESAISVVNMTGTLRVFIDGNDIGEFKIDAERAFEIPATARSFQLRQKDLLLDSTKAMSNLITLPASAGAKISVDCLSNGGNMIDCALADF